MKLQKFVIVGLSAILVVQLSACQYLPKDTFQSMGAVIGGVAGNKLGEKAGALRPLFTGLGAIIGAELGKRLGQYLSEQDQQKLQQQMKVQAQNPKPQVSVACTGEQGGTYRSVSMRQARSTNCGSEKKVILASSATTKIDGQECKSISTELPETPMDTIKQQICKGTDGEWHPKNV